jgi:hypothetical protein
MAGRQEHGNVIVSRFMQVWATLIGSLAMIALILTAFGVTLGMVKPADSVKRLGAILGIVIVLLVVPGVIASAWSSMSLWQRLGVTVIGIIVLLVLRPRRKANNRQNR